jgi:hypothetical protein
VAAITILDWTAERLRAWTVGEHLRPVALEDGTNTLPLVVSLAERRPQVGKAGRSLLRRAPHQVVENFLPHVGSERRWQHGRHDVDARDLLQLVLVKIKERLPGKAVGHAVPNYWNPDQVALLEDVTRLSGFRLLGTTRRGLASAGMNPGLLIDGDSHAVIVTVTKLTEPGPRLRLNQTVVKSELGLPIWRERIAALIASRCVRDCRRDPRAHPETDQLLLEQIEMQLYDWASSAVGRVTFEGREWQHDLVISSDDVQRVCQPLATVVAQQVVRLAEVHTWFLTPEASRLPGIAAALYAASQNQRSVSVLAAEQLPQTLTGLFGMVERGLMAPLQFQEALPTPPEGASDHPADTLPFPGRRTRGERK